MSEPIKLPVRVFNLKPTFKLGTDKRRVRFPDLKILIRNLARNYNLYFTPVDLGEKKEGYPENLGQWVFGTPNFKGHYKQNLDKEYEITDHVTIYLPPIEEAIELVKLGLEEAKRAGFVLDYKKVG